MAVQKVTVPVSAEKTAIAVVWFRAKDQLSSAVVEGFDAQVEFTIGKAYGFRTYHGLEVTWYPALGALPEPKFTHRFS
jgi:hypothetical protein